jgi:hypothetical protein
MNRALVKYGPLPEGLCDPNPILDPYRDQSDIQSYFSCWKEKGPACVIANNPFILKKIFDYVIQHEMETLPIGSDLFEKFFSKFVDINCGMLVICIDDFDGLGRIFHKLRSFRDERPNVPLLVSSAKFRSDDLSQERLAVCDVSIRLPLGSDDIESTFAATWTNNKAWEKRVHELEFEKLRQSDKPD